MLIAVACLIIGVSLGRTTPVFWLIPTAAIASLGLLAIWLATGQLGWIKLAIWFGYMAALNTGYLAGAAWRLDTGEGI